MAEETIIADELDVNETENVEEVSEDTEDYVDVNALQSELAKAKEEKEKRENRYKSTMKKNSQPKQETKVEKKEVDLDSLVERKLYAIEEQREFIKTYGEETFNEVKKIKDKHPTLSLNDAYKISPVANDPASKRDPESMSMWGRANANVINDSKSIKLEDYVKLDKDAYAIMKNRIRKGEITLKN